MIKIIIFSFSILAFLNACSIAPKADYSRTQIDRPYSLPEDVAVVQFGPRYLNVNEELQDPQAESTSKDEYNDNGLLGSLYFENGITENFSWVYPLGAKYTFLKNDQHTFGVSAFTFFLYSSLSADYWFRLNKKTSIRSSFNASHFFGSIFYEQRFWGPKLELIRQFNKHFSAGFSVSYEKATFESKFFNIFFNDERIIARYQGGTLELNTLYSINNRWDIISKFQYSKYDPIENSEYDLEIASAMVGANFYW